MASNGSVAHAGSPSISTCSRRSRREASGPNRRRGAVTALRQRFGVSERRACSVVGLHRSTMRLTPAPMTTEETELRAWLRQFLVDRARLWAAPGSDDGPPSRMGGQRQTHRPTVARGGPARATTAPEDAADRYRCGSGRDVTDRPNVFWAMHFQIDTTADGRTLKMLNVIDEFTREALATDVSLHRRRWRRRCVGTSSAHAWGVSTPNWKSPLVAR